MRNVRRRYRNGTGTVTTGPSEKELQADVIALLKLTGWIVYHTFDSRRSAPGFPDLIAIRGRRLLALELKTASGKVTEDQYTWLKAFAGVDRVEAYVVRPENVDQLSAIVSM